MAVPVITQVTPTGGSEGATVTITGTDLGTPTAVHFGAVDATSFAGASATQAFAVAPAGTGTVHVTLTTAGGTSAGVDFTYGDALFTVAEARGFDKLHLASATTYPDAVIVAKEAELREWFVQIFGVDFFPTTHTDEVADGLGYSEVMLKWPRITAITALSYRTYGSSTWTALDAGQLAYCQPTLSGTVIWEGGCLPRGRNTVKATYTAGHAAVPARIKRAALQLAVAELVPSNLPDDASGYDIGGTTVTFGRADGFRDNWFQSNDGQAAYRAYSMKLPGIA